MTVDAFNKINALAIERATKLKNLEQELQNLNDEINIKMQSLKSLLIKVKKDNYIFFENDIKRIKLEINDLNNKAKKTKIDIKELPKVNDDKNLYIMLKEETKQMNLYRSKKNIEDIFYSYQNLLQDYKKNICEIESILQNFNEIKIHLNNSSRNQIVSWCNSMIPFHSDITLLLEIEKSFCDLYKTVNMRETSIKMLVQNIKEG